MTQPARMHFGLRWLFFLTIVASLIAMGIASRYDSIRRGRIANRYQAEARKQRQIAIEQRGIALEKEQQAKEYKLEAQRQKDIAEAKRQWAKDVVGELVRTPQRAHDLAKRALAEAGVSDEQAQQILERLPPQPGEMQEMHDAINRSEHLNEEWKRLFAELVLQTDAWECGLNAAIGMRSLWILKIDPQRLSSLVHNGGMIDIAWSAFAEDEPSPFRVYLLQKRFATTWPTPLFCVITDSQYRLQTWKEFASSFDVRRATLENDVLEVEYTAGRRLARRVATSKYRLTPASIELLTSERSVAEHE